MKIDKIPTTIGVYLFTKKGRPIYVGKAINIKARLKSHLENAKFDKKEALIVNTADKIEFIPTDSEFNALLLESALIRTHHPRYNVRWKDDKSYLYIKITVQEKYPKIHLARSPHFAEAKYFGPFPSVRSVDEILSHIRKAFPFCRQKNISKRPCFYAKIGLCDPCPNYVEFKVQSSEFKIEERKRYKRNIRNVIKILNGKTDAVLKDLYKELKMVSKNLEYEKALELRNKILRLEKLIYQTRFINNSTTGNLALNGRRELERFLKMHISDIDNLKRIECYDISNFQFKEATGSMVVFTDGYANKAEYRKFKIKNPKPRSDFEMLEETLKRRFKNKWPKPNLIVVDGGKPQVRLALNVLMNLDEKIPLVGIAKNPDRLIIGNNNFSTIRPNLNNPGFNLLRLVRDESHRFARKYHLNLRSKNLFK